MNLQRLMMAATLACLITACGGGGGGDSDEGGPGTPSSPTGSIDPLSGILTPSRALTYTWTPINGIPVRMPSGTTAYSATLTTDATLGTQTRRYVVVRPNPLPASAPLLMILHPRDTAPELTANFTHVADFVATQGIWAVLPEAVGGKWKGEPLEGADDELFISALIDALIDGGVDPDRVTVAGYSSGGVMAQRLACEMAERIAAFGVVATTLPASLWSCTPSEPRPKVYILGTDDPYAPYDGIAGLGSASALMDHWAAQQGCTGTAPTRSLPNIADDGMTVQLDERTGCTSGRGLRLYTVHNGEHAWPDPASDPDYVTYAGRTTRDMSATGAIWSFASGYRR